MARNDQDKEDAFTFRIQNLFDGRYVLKDGVYKLAIAIVFTGSALILTAFFTGIIAYFFHISTPL